MQQSVVERDNDTTEFIGANEERIELVLDLFGSKPNDLGHEFEAPTMWSTIALIVEQLSGISVTISISISSKISALQPMLSTNLALLMNQEVDKINSRIGNLKQAILQIGAYARGNAAAATTPQHQHLGQRSSFGSGALETRIAELDSEITSLKAINDSSAVRFFSLGFK